MTDRRKILVVEIEEDARARLVDLLHSEYEVAHACCGTDAICRLGSDNYDLLLLGGIGNGPDNQAFFHGLSAVSGRPKVILIADAFSAEVMSRAAFLDADGVIESRDDHEVSAAVAAHLGS
jgi:hypothetical protein